MKAPLFSILHTSARPDKWRAVYDDWMSKAVHPEDVEYVLCIDPRWGFSMDPTDYDPSLPSRVAAGCNKLSFDNLHVVVNNQRRCYVDGVNIAAKASTGSILIVNADDQFACENWDELLSIKVEFSALGKGGNGPFVIEVSTGTPDEHERGIIGTCAILSRARYEQQGFVFYVEYESLFADNDFCETARQDGVVIDARHLMFPHRHPMFDEKGGWRTDWKERADVALLAQNRTEALEIGREVYKRRKISGFPPMQRGIVKRSIALCLSGERFEAVWTDALLTLYGHLIDLDFSILRARPLGENTNVYEMRQTIRRGVLGFTPRPELCLWLDDDNILTPEHFSMLLADLDAHSEVDGVSGWCWIHTRDKKGFMVSCGERAPDGLHWSPFHPSFRHAQELRPFDAGGFPAILMRTSALEKAGEDCFLPILDNRFEYGMSGEDMAFFIRAEKGGARFLADPRVRVPHLKYVTVEPMFPEEGKVPVKVACMMRVKNEARWIQHTIDSVRELCGDLIYVMEDGSTDDTRAICEAAGVVLLPSPYEGQGLDESRDKDWLLQEVISRCHPDWILMPDGDEELQAGGCAAILRALETNPPCDCFALRFLYFWNSIDTIRLDGVYGTMARQSLFRANADFRFRSYYSQDESPNQNHVGLHTSNAPGLGGKVLPLNVALLHYGYLHREDRIRKFAWITNLDPHNEGEGYYLHCVQGDIPEVPADAQLKHAGPLKLQTLPARLVPKFDVVPGPVDCGCIGIGESCMHTNQARQYAGEKMERRAESTAADCPVCGHSGEGCTYGFCVNNGLTVGSEEWHRMKYRRRQSASAD